MKHNICNINLDVLKFERLGLNTTGSLKKSITLNLMKLMDYVVYPKETYWNQELFRKFSYCFWVSARVFLWTVLLGNTVSTYMWLPLFKALLPICSILFMFWLIFNLPAHPLFGFIIKC